jgi:hypothetical protein
MPDFIREDLTGARFDQVDLTGARFRNVDLTGAKISGALLVNLDIDGLLENITINGVDVVPLVEAELDRRYPDRAQMRPADAAGYREAWDILERLWQQTVARARQLDPDLLHERVDGEYSFIETLRHLVFATDAWITRAILGEPSPFDPLGLPHDEMPDDLPVPNDRTARPSLDQVLALRADRMATMRQVLAGLTDDYLAGMTEPVTEPGYPAPESFPVRRCLGAILNEEWEHRLFAERDLAILEKKFLHRKKATDFPSFADEHDTQRLPAVGSPANSAAGRGGQTGRGASHGHAREGAVQAACAAIGSRAAAGGGVLLAGPAAPRPGPGQDDGAGARRRDLRGAGQPGRHRQDPAGRGLS